MIRHAKRKVSEVISTDELSVEIINNDTFIGNTLGMPLAQIFCQQEKMNSKISSLENTVQKLTADNEAISAEIEHLRKIPEGNTLLRHRFLSTYKRDKLKVADRSDFKYIVEGNEWDHCGDALLDPDLYMTPSARSDFDVYEKLYGLDPAAAKRSAYMATINLLNQHATIIASPYHTCREQFSTTFSNFIKELKKSGYAGAYLYDNNKYPELNQAYWAFYSAIKTDVEKIEQLLQL